MDGSATVNEQNLHPFRFPGSQLAMAHNGDLYQFASMRYDLIPHIPKKILSLIRGNTDSEWIYALLMSQFTDYTARHSSEEISVALQQTLSILREVRNKHHIEISSSVNLFISSPGCLVASRFAFDYGCYPLPDKDEVHQGSVDYLSLWFTRGSDFDQHDGEWKMVGGKESAESIIVASEPLSVDTSTWVEVPEYHLLAVNQKTSGIETKLVPLN
jgi:glutamine amidotransferase